MYIEPSKNLASILFLSAFKTFFKLIIAALRSPLSNATFASAKYSVGVLLSPHPKSIVVIRTPVQANLDL